MVRWVRVRTISAIARQVDWIVIGFGGESVAKAWVVMVTELSVVIPAPALEVVIVEDDAGEVITSRDRDGSSVEGAAKSVGGA